MLTASCVSPSPKAIPHHIVSGAAHGNNIRRGVAVQVAAAQILGGYFSVDHRLRPRLFTSIEIIKRYAMIFPAMAGKNLVIAVAILVVHQWLVRRAMVRQTFVQAGAIARSVESTAGYYVIFRIDSDLQAIIRDLRKNPSIRYADFLGPGGEHLASTLPKVPPEVAAQPLARSDGVQLADGNYLFVIPFFETQTDKTKPKGYFRLMTDSSDADRAASELRWWNVIISLGSTASILLTSSLAGFVFAKYKFPLRGPLFMLILASAIIPLEAYMIPLYIMVFKAHMLNTYGALIFPITVTPSGTPPQALPHQRNAFGEQAGEHSARAGCSPGRRNAFRLSPESLPDFVRDRVDAFRAPEALRGVRDEITRTLTGRIQLRYRLVKVHPDPAD